MDEIEYERRRRALEETYQADLALVQAAHAARLRSLDALRTSPAAPPQEPPAETPAVQPQAPPPPPAPQRPDLRTAVEEILPQLPEVFDKKDVAAALRWAPNRSSLQRVLSEMEEDGFLQFMQLSSGRVPSRYRKT